MSTIQRALVAATFVLVAATGANAQAPSHAGGAVAIGSDSASGQPAPRSNAVPNRGNAAQGQNYGAVAIGSDSASGRPVVAPRASAPVQPYRGATMGARAIGSDH
jgi:hypothetical protein